MGFRDLVVGGVAIAYKLTGNLQTLVSHEAFVSETTKGDRSYGPPVMRPAIVQMAATSVVSSSGEMTYSRANLTLLDPSVIVTDDDKFTLPDGTTGPIVLRKGLVDPVTGRPFLTQVYLG